MSGDALKMIRTDRGYKVILNGVEVKTAQEVDLGTIRGKGPHRVKLDLLCEITITDEAPT